MEVTSSTSEQRELITAREAKKAFTQAGLSVATFHRRVSAGQIDSILPEGRQRGALYPKDQVLASIGQKGKIATRVKGATFAKMKPEDMTQVAPVMQELFGGYPNIERWSSVLARNSDMAYMLISDDKAIGCGFIMPLTETKILDILSKEVTPPTHPQEVQEYQPGSEYYLYARTIGVTQKDVTTIQRRFWASLLVRNLMRAVVNLGTRGIIIKKIYGRSDTPEGERLMFNMGFTQIRTITSHKNFIIDVETSGLDIILRYEKALDQWKQKYGGL